MVGTTRSRINLFMNRFRKLGFIDYSIKAGLTVNHGLLSVVLNDGGEVMVISSAVCSSFLPLQPCEGLFIEPSPPPPVAESRQG